MRGRTITILAVLFVGLVAVTVIGKFRQKGEGEDSGIVPTTSQAQARTTFPALEWEPVDLGDSTAWSKFSFSGFSIKLPRDWRVVKLSETHDSVEFAQDLTIAKDAAERQDTELDRGDNNFSLKVSYEALSKPLHEQVSEVDDAWFVVDGQTAVKTKNESGFRVQVEVIGQRRLYSFDFGFSEASYEEFVELVLSSVSFQQRAQVD